MQRILELLSLAEDALVACILSRKSHGHGEMVDGGEAGDRQRSRLRAKIQEG